jgi:hypothetical protein
VGAFEKTMDRKLDLEIDKPLLRLLFYGGGCGLLIAME